MCKIKPLFDSKHIKSIKGQLDLSLIYYLKRYLMRCFTFFELFKHDIIFIEKEFLPYFPAFFERLMKLFNIKFILDYDDAIFHNYDSSPNILIKKILKNKIPVSISKASAVICGSKYLFNFSEKYNNNVFLIPTTIKLKDYPLNTRNVSGKFVIGWIGSYTTTKFILPIIDLLISFLEGKNAEIHLFGANPKIIKTKSKNVKIIEWSKDKEYDSLSSMSVGISPLDNTPFSRGKCAFKSIQYMAVSRPVITNPVGANADVVLDGISGFHVHSEEDWLEALNELYFNRERIVEMGMIGRNEVEKKYSFEVCGQRYLDLLKGLFENEKTKN